MGDQEGKPGLRGTRDLGSIRVGLWSRKLEVQNGSSKARFGQTTMKAKGVCDVRSGQRGVRLTEGPGPLALRNPETGSPHTGPEPGKGTEEEEPASWKSAFPTRAREAQSTRRMP